MNRQSQVLVGLAVAISAVVGFTLGSSRGDSADSGPMRDDPDSSTAMPDSSSTTEVATDGRVITFQRQVIQENPRGIPLTNGYYEFSDAVKGEYATGGQGLPDGTCYSTGFGGGNTLFVYGDGLDLLGSVAFEDVGEVAQISQPDYDALFDQFHGSSMFGDPSGDIWVCTWTVTLALSNDADAYLFSIPETFGYQAMSSEGGWYNPYEPASPCNWEWLPGTSCFPGYEVTYTASELEQMGWLVQLCDEPSDAVADFQCVRTGGE